MVVRVSEVSTPAGGTEARVYYDRKRAEGKAHWSALRCLARQLGRIV